MPPIPKTTDDAGELLTEAGWFDIISNALCLQNLKNVLPWWESAALSCMASNNAQLITSRDGTIPYMLRCWLTPPRPLSSVALAKYESGNAVLLHWILKPDDCPLLHNHPWQFATFILAGGYVEEFKPTFIAHPSVALTHSPNDCAIRTLNNFHRIASHRDGDGDPFTGLGGTWTLVTTGHRLQRWSFLLDGVPVDAEAYLTDKHKATP